MNLKRWKIGAIVSIFTGLATAFAVGFVVPTMTLKEGIFVCLASIGKDFLLFQKQHPVEDISFDTAEVKKTKEQNNAIENCK